MEHALLVRNAVSKVKTATTFGIPVIQPAVTATGYEALFASALQPSDFPTASMIAEAISGAIGQFGVRGCAGRMAQEFGDYPDAAASRMRWVRQLAQITGGRR